MKSNHFTLTKWSPQKLELFVLVALTALSVILFSSSTLDFWAAKKFFHPDTPLDFWANQTHPLWIFFYHAAPWLTGFLLLGSFGVLLGSRFRKNLEPKRLSAVFIFLVVALGSGLTINAVLKPYWGRPRPREIAEFGGTKNYRPFYSPAVGASGKSFPCGHCSVGFSYGLFWWLLRGRRPKTAGLCLLGSLALGGLMGAGRIAAGGHFLSDVVWSGLIVYWVCYLVYYFVLPTIGQRFIADNVSSLGSDTSSKKLSPHAKKPITLLLYGVALMAIVVTLLIATPFQHEYNLKGRTQVGLTAAEVANSLLIEIDRAQVQMSFDPTLNLPFIISGQAQGFGFPGNRVFTNCEQPLQEVLCKVKRSGLFSDFESSVKVTVNPTMFKNFTLKLKEGSITRDLNQPLPENFQLIDSQ